MYAVDRTLRALRPSWVVLVAWVLVVLAARLVVQDLVQNHLHVRLPFPPLDASLDWRPNWRLLLPATVGLGAVVAGPRVARRVSWLRLLVGSAVLAGAWAVALALFDGVHGLVGPVTLKNEYFLDVGRVGSPRAFLHGFVSHIDDYRVHVRGHPPGFLLGLWGLDHVGLGSPGTVAAIEVAVGALAVPAVLVAVREVASESVARAAAPFVAVAPLAIWVATSADALFAGVGAWAVTLVILATGRSGRARVVYAGAGGLLFGVTAFLSYGLVLLALIPAGVALHRRTWVPLAAAAAGAAVVFLAFAAAGFWWFDGLAATHEQYYAGVASRRPYLQFLLVDLACLAIALGPACAVALARRRDRRLWLLVGSALAAMGLAALSGMSKGEVERIWLPFAIWVLPAGAALAAGPRRSGWLASQVAFTLALQTVVRSPW
jgi:hypothetical protein